MLRVLRIGESDRLRDVVRRSSCPVCGVWREMRDGWAGLFFCDLWGVVWCGLWTELGRETVLGWDVLLHSVLGS